MTLPWHGRNSCAERQIAVNPMDLYSAAIFAGPVIAVIITWRVLKRRYDRQFPPRRVVEIRDDIADTF